ncbi:8191_t:CDS:1 [Racocetra persica]|uniref:8191_t:CDS:1 n=1 Tax=Racocetra persica TaxID=160502 RepID=A0ACA9MIF5_9GLOM|nr:8191_t:CDS:1 [Racocetra persica]
MNSKNNEGFAIVHENPMPSPSSLQMEHDCLLVLANELLKQLPDKLTLSLEEILAPRDTEENAKKQPRSQNKFILFRKEYTAYVKKQDPDRAKSMNTDEISKGTSKHWETLPPQGKQLFTILSNIADKRHRMKYPNYVYKPQKKESKQTFSEETSFEETNHV